MEVQDVMLLYSYYCKIRGASVMNTSASNNWGGDLSAVKQTTLTPAT